MSVDHFKVLVAAALADGSLDDSERPLLLDAAASFGVAAGDVDRIIEEGRGGGLKGKIPSDPAARSKLFMALLKVVAADGDISKGEEKLFLRLSSSFGLNELEAEDLLRASVKRL